MDPDGFYYGAIGRRFGLVPSNMVYEIAKNEFVPERRRSEVYPSGSVATANHLLNRRARWGSIKSRSYDNPADHRSYQNAAQTTTRQPRYQSTRPKNFDQINGIDSSGATAYGSPILDPSTTRRERSMPPPLSARYYAPHENTKTPGNYSAALPLSARNANSNGQLPRQHYYNDYPPPTTSYDYPPNVANTQRRPSFERDLYEKQNDYYSQQRDYSQPPPRREQPQPSTEYRGAVCDQYVYGLPTRQEPDYLNNRYNDYNSGTPQRAQQRQAFPMTQQTYQNEDLRHQQQYSQNDNQQNR